MLEQYSEPPKGRPVVWRALLAAFLVELGVMILCGGAMIRSFFAHAAADPNSTSNNPLAVVGILFHIPAFIITGPLGLVFLAPLVQILLMWGVFALILRWAKSRGRLA